MSEIEVANVRGIIWDLDGTLLDSFGLYVGVLGEIVGERGLDMPNDEQFTNNYHGSLEDSIRGTLGLESDFELAEIVTSFLEKQDPRYEKPEEHLFNDAVLLAQQAAQKGIEQLVVTNREHGSRGLASPRSIVAATALAECINEIRCGDEVEFRKPHRNVAEDWMAKHNIAAENLLIVGDQHVDAELAVNLGARALIVERNGKIPHLDSSDDKHKELILVETLHGIKLTDN